jgi:hypothetical protein
VEGYTIRGITLKGLILQESAPPLDEISRFNAAGQAEAEDMNVSSSYACCGSSSSEGWGVCVLRSG